MVEIETEYIGTEFNNIENEIRFNSPSMIQILLDNINNNNKMLNNSDKLNTEKQ